MSVVKGSVWKPEETPGLDDELFWHATTFESVRKLYASDGINITLGTGWMGPGFYVTTKKSDYQKMMAFRNLQNNFKDENDRENYGHPMYLLCVMVKDFWKMKAEIRDGYQPPSTFPDFIGIRWGGDYGTEERTIKKPGGGSYQSRSYARMGYYQNEPMHQVGVMASNGGGYVEDYGGKGARNIVLSKLWDMCKSNIRSESTGNSSLDLQVSMVGPRKVFMSTLKELAFVNQSLTDKIYIVAAKAFSHKKMSFPDAPNYSDSKLEKDYIGLSLDFDDDKWVDMGWLEQKILEFKVG